MELSEKEKKVLVYILDKIIEFVIITSAVAVGFIIASGFVAKQIAQALGG
ncbi:hypothetical protein OCC_02194 [Thermococcus litoralis DSM 5473]|uniref:Uncharacterized protein n=1 Tax=Thermococcus litoralis (strain ATCC 51850 / DSM 5473 / JCM 8560 / NS-C) TaxID=523849 RepID=H3ZJX5_THELN|nr:hypothetical protein [Thermococcus litoralis]EHR79749.1 hypothetical protein OCC_02194 [Thermococcus litoralis DSM 5473]